MVLDDETLSQSPTNVETWDSPDPSSPQAAFFPNKLNREYLRPPMAFYLYTRFLTPQLWEHRVLERASKHLEMAKSILRRNPSQDEINAFVEHTSREVNMRGLGMPIGLSAGFIHTNLFLRKKLSIPRNVPVFQGIQQAWASVATTDRRALLFQAAIRTSFWLLLSMGNFQGFATYQFTLGLGSDERLGPFREAVKKYTNARLQRLEGNSEQARQRREGREAIRHNPPATAVAEEYPQPDYGRGQESTSTSTSTSAPDYVWGGREQKQADFTDSFLKDDRSTDDASPVASELQTQQNTNKSTNSWERIRQERSQQQPQMTANSPAMWRGRAFKQVEQEQQFQNPTTDYATEEKSRQQERDAAQREFDQMLDAERQLSQGDSSGSNSGENNRKAGRRW
jgi:hypothetical protein